MSSPKVRLMKELERWVDWMLYERSLLGFKQKPKETRIRPKEYWSYLAVYDLRKKGMKFREIGEHVWPRSLVDTEKKAKEYFRRARDLVVNPPLKPVELGRIFKCLSIPGHLTS